MMIVYGFDLTFPVYESAPYGGPLQPPRDRIFLHILDVHVSKKPFHVAVTIRVGTSCSIAALPGSQLPRRWGELISFKRRPSSWPVPMLHSCSFSSTSRIPF